MTCDRATEIDLAAFAADPQAPEWSAFRSHYPRCADCSGEVAAWGRLRGALEGAIPMPSEHVESQEILDFASDPDRLPASRRQPIESHLSGCARCRNELAVLRRFDFAALPGAATVPAEPRWTLARWLADLSESLFGGALRPAWAMALSALLAIPAGLVVWQLVRSPTPTDLPPIAKDESVPAPAEEAPRAEPAPPSQLAHEPAPTPESPETPQAPALPTPPPPESRIAKAPGAATPGAGRDRAPDALPPPPRPPAFPRDPGSADAPSTIAALLPQEPPVYRPKLALAGGSFAPVRSATVIRSAGGKVAEIRALGPEHVGATQSAAPTLYWHLAEPSSVPVELTVTDDRRPEPLLELTLDPPVAAGLHSLELAAHGVALEPGVTYQWFATAVRDPDRRDADVIARAAVRREPPSEALERSLSEESTGLRAHRLAEAGYWYDAFDALSRLADAAPEVPRAAAQRAALLEQVGLGEVAKALANPPR